jgi:phytoene dehydrogenase-like protein
MSNYDAIVIGAGHNGLTNAAYLAKAGLNVVVLEKNDYIGGATASREMHEGWIYSSCSYVCSIMRQALHRDLDLGRHGLLLIPYVATVNFGDDDERLISYHDEHAAYLELKRHSPHDADAMHRFGADLTRYSQFIRKTLLRTPPDPVSLRPRDIRELLFLGKQMWKLGEKEIYEYVRFFTMSAADFLDDYFENDLIKAAMASPGIIGTALGVCSPGSSYVLLHHVMGDVDGTIGAWGLVRGGMGAIADALSGALQEHGGEVRTNAGVQQILVKNRKAREANVHPHHGPQRPAGWHLRESEELQDSWLVRQSQYRFVRLAEIYGPAGKPLHRSRGTGVHRLHGNHGTCLRLLEAWPLVR